MKNSRIIPAAIFYSISVFLAEVTFGNPEFPFTLWVFDNLSAYKWSVPVHLAGFLWLIFWNKMFAEKHVIFPAIMATVFFLCGETLNRFFLHYFKYQEIFFRSAEFSFWIIIGLYFILCFATGFILRSKDQG
ncbi:MAG: hypothetical protein R6X10_12390 [Desulfobacterales bacterium]